MTRYEKMMEAADAYAEELYKDEPRNFKIEEEISETIADFCAGWNAAEKNDGINWKAFRAQVAKMMLPLMYKQVEINGRMVSSHAQQAVEAAVEIAEALERRLREEG